MNLIDGMGFLGSCHLLVFFFVVVVVGYCNAVLTVQQHANSMSAGQSTGPRFQNELPTEVTFTPDRGTRLDCPAVGQPSPQIGWLTSKGNGGAVDGVMWSAVVDLANLISVAPNGSLTLHAFRPEHFRPDVHAATYKCSAVNSIGRILSTPVRVRAVMLPSFEATVESPRVRRGGTAVLRCNVPESVRDHVTITSWIQDNRYDIFLTSSQDGRHVMLPNGELHVLSVRQGDDSHLYHCRVLVRPNGQTMTSSSAGRILLVADSVTKTAPVIVESANRVRVWRGQDAVLPCIFQGYPPPKIKWYRSQTAQYGNLMLPLIATQQRQQQMNGGGAGGGRHRFIDGTLVIHSIVAEDQGRYVCSVNNSIGTVEARTELVFQEKLQVRILEASHGVVPLSTGGAVQLMADAETAVTITCSYSGSPRPVVSWLKDGQRYLGNGRVAFVPDAVGGGDVIQLHITSVQRDDQGMYQCLAMNDEGDAAQASIQLVIAAFPPHLQQTFSRQVLHPGSSVSLKCVASGIPPPHWTWMLDDSPLPVSERYFLGQQQQTGVEDQVVTHLNISHVRIEDGGHYKCVAENRVGRVEYGASLHVYGPPYVRPMANVVAVGGKKLELVCPVAGYPIETITWEKDGRRLPLNSRQRLQFNGTLSIDPVDKSSDAGLYSCEARGQNGLTARQSLQLAIIDAPHMMPMSDSAVLNAGERLALQCAVVKGGLPLAVTWLKDGQVIPVATASNHNSATATLVRLVNDFTASLTVESLSGHHAGLYVCRATNEAGRAQVAVHVVVQASPRITPFGMPSRSVMVNSRVQVSCVVEEGDPPFRIRWYRNERPLIVQQPAGANRLLLASPSVGDAGGGTGVRLTDFDAYSSILTIDQVTVNHGGNYSCRAENAAGTAVHSTLLQVSVPPHWLNQPPAETIQTVSGHSVELTCLVHGVPTPQVTWSFSPDKKSDKYVGVFNTNRTLVTNQSLIISPVDMTDQGFYQCEAVNGIGTSISAIMSLQVHAPPQVHLNQDYMAVKRGSPAGTVLKCSVRGEAPLNIQWRKDSSPIDASTSSSSHSKIVTRSHPSAATSAGSSATTGSMFVSELSVLNAASADEGLYECLASNVYGQDSDVLFLQVQDVPHPPTDVRVSLAASRTIQLEWKPPLIDGGNPLQEFLIFYQSANGDVRQERIPASQSSGTIENLIPATSYHVHLTASNALGQSQPSVGLTVTTDEEAPEGPPLQLAVSSMTSRSITITWSPPASRLQNGLIHSYLVTMDSGRTINRTVVAAPTTDYSATALRPNTNYLIYVQAVNSKGTGPSSSSVSVKTGEDVPEEPPLNVACVALSSQSLQITWQPPRPDYRNGLLRGYRVFYEPVNELFYYSAMTPAPPPLHPSSSSLDQAADPSVGHWQTTTELTMFLSGLQKFANYSVQVLAFTSAGDGVRSQPLICTTEEDIPEMPSKLKVVQSGTDSLTVSWLPHPRPNGRIVHYTVYSKEIERGQDINPQKWTAPSNGPSAGRLEIRNLRPRRTVFYFQVAAVSSQAGEGPRSSTVSFTFNPTNKLSAAVVSIGSDYLVPRWSRLILPCTAIGDTPLQISWFQDGRQLSEWLNLSPSKLLAEQMAQPWIQPPLLFTNLFPSASEDSGLIQVLTNGSLSIGRLADNAGGNYTCAARNRHGQDRVDYFLTVVTPPPTPQLRFAASNWSSISLQWSSNQQPDKTSNNRTKVSATRNYVIKYRTRTSDAGYPFQWVEKSLPASWRSVPVGDLQCGTEYEFVLLASSRVGNSSSSNSVTAKTKGSPPEYLTLTDESDVILTATSATVNLVHWQDRGCPIQQFVFRFRTADSGEWIIAGAESPPQRHFLLGGLLPAREYAVRVTAINAAGSAVKDYAIRTPPLVDGSGGHSDSSVIYSSSLAPLFSDPRVAVPMAVSSLAILLTVVTLLLRYRYRSGSGDYIRPDPPQSIGNHIRSYNDGANTPDDGCSTLSASHKRPVPGIHSTTGSGASDYADEVSPYAVFPSLLAGGGGKLTGGQFSSTRRMKTFVVDGTKDPTVPVEMSNYAAPSTEEPTYDYIAPCPSERVMGRNKLPSNPQSVFVPIIPARSTWNQQYRHGGGHHASQHYHTDWNNQETLALSQRL